MKKTQERTKEIDALKAANKPSEQDRIEAKAQDRQVEQWEKAAKAKEKQAQASECLEFFFLFEIKILTSEYF